MKTLAFILIGLMTFLLVIDARKGILCGLFIRPIIDICWEFKYQAMGFRPPELISAIFPLLVFLRILMGREEGFLHRPLSILWIIYIFCQLLSGALILTAGGGIWASLDFFLRIFNGFVGYFMLQEFFRRREDFQILLITLLLASLTPLGMSFYQNILGGPLYTEPTAGTLLRNIGLYHDAFTLRLYAFQAIIAAMLYWYSFAEGKRLVKIFLAALLALAAVTVYKLHSKAGYLIAAIWMALHSLYDKRFVILLVLLLAGLTLLGTSGFLAKVKETFTAEVDFFEGEAKPEQTLAGRVPGWKSLWERWLKLPIHLKMIGDSASHTGAHNDFLRALVGTGVLGLSVYVSLLAAVGIKALRNFLRERTPLNLTAMMLFSMWLVDAMGLVPGVYPSYQWFAWGFIGLAFRGVEGLDDPEASLKPQVA